MQDSTPFPALIGVAHGSRNPASASATEALVQEAGKFLGVEAHAAYLEDFAEPSISVVAERLTQHGYAEAVAVPLLFTSAYHATDDAPLAIAEATRAHGVTITQSEVLGTGDDLVEVLAQHLLTHESAYVADPNDDVMLLGVGSSRTGANDAVASLAERLACFTGRKVNARFATCKPRATDFLADASETGTVLPLFTAPGKLLDASRQHADQAGWITLPHLGTSLAPLVAQRYSAVLAPH